MEVETFHKSLFLNDVSVAYRALLHSCKPAALYITAASMLTHMYMYMYIVYVHVGNTIGVYM